MGDEQARVVAALLNVWSGDMIAKFADEEFMAGAADPDTWIAGSEWEFVAEEGSQSLGMTSGQKGLDGLLAIWARWLEAFERWEAEPDGAPIALERERVLARIHVQARSHAGLELDFVCGLIYSFDGPTLRLVQAYGTWDAALEAAGIDEQEAERRGREGARSLPVDRAS
jgi:hypothetical protein